MEAHSALPATYKTSKDNMGILSMIQLLEHVEFLLVFVGTRPLGREVFRADQTVGT